MDVAVSKVPKIRYKGLTDEQNDALYEIAQIVLLRAKMENNSDEVAITLDFLTHCTEAGLYYH